MPELAYVHPAHMITEREVTDLRDHIQASLKVRNASLKAADTAPPVKPARPDYSKMSNFDLKLIRERFEVTTNHSQRLSEATAREFELEQQEKDLAGIVAQCHDPKSSLTKQERREILETLCGRDFASQATRHSDHPVMLHEDGTLDAVRAELSQIRSELPRLVRQAQLYLWNQENLPTPQEVRAAFDRERKVKDLVR
jgi:hypothetical protein